MPKILIADDELTTRMEIEEMLTSLGYEVVGEAESGRQAVDMALQLKPDLVLMDIVMPGEMDGISAAEEIKAQSDAAIVFINGYGNGEYVERAKRVGPFGYVMKPFDEKEIRGFVEIALYKKDMENRMKASHAQLSALFENTDDFIMIADERGIPQSFNAAYERIIKETLDLDMKPGIQPHKFLKDPKAVHYWDELHRRVLNGEKFKAEFTQKLISGETRHFEFSFCPIIQSGEVKGFVEVTRDVTEHQRILEEVKESRERYRKLVNHAPAGVFEVDFVKQRFVQVNDAMCEYTGYTREEFLSMSLFDIIDEESKSVFKERQKKILSGESVPENVEFKIRAKGGRAFWILSSSSFIYENKKIRGAHVVVHDITERRRMEEEIRKSRREWEGIFQGIGQPTLMLDGEQNIIEANTATAQATGKPKQELIGKKCFEVCHNGTGPPEECPFEEVRSSGHLETVEMEMEAFNGTYLISCTPLFDPDGNLEKVIHIATDVTEQKRIRRSLQESEHRYRSLFEEAPIGIAVLDNDRNILDFNDTMLTINGYAREDRASFGNTRQFYVNSADTEKVASELSDQGFVNEMEIKLKRKDGTPYDALLTMQPIDIGGDRLWHSMIQDISERKKVEKALQKSEKDFKDLFNNAPLGYVEYDQEGRIARVNQTNLDMLGYKREEVVGQFVWDFYVEAKEAREQILSKLADKRPPGRAFTRTFRLKDGSTVPVLVEDRLIRNDQGDIETIRCTYQDITKRARIEELLNRRVEFERLISQISSDFINLNPNDMDEGINAALASIGTFTNADRAYIFQYKDSGTKYMDNTHEWCAEGIEPQIENLQDITLQEELPWFTERILKREIFRVPDVTSLPAEARLERKHFESQDIQSLIVVPMVFGDRDIGFLGFDSVRTRRTWTAEDASLLRLVGETITHTIISKRNEQALRKSEGKYRLLVEKINDVVFSLDTKGTVTYISPVIETVLGYSPDELIGKNAMEVIHVDDQPRSAERFRARITLGSSKPEKYKLMSKSGEIRWATVSSRPVYDNGEVVSIHGILTDITESIRLEEHLQHAYKMEAIATLTGGIAHDYNNLLSIIVGNLGLAQQDAKPGSDQVEFLTEAEKAARKVGELTHELMALSRGGGPIKELGSIVKTLNQATREVPAENDISIEKSIPDELWPIPHDARKMGAVFRNVIKNALEAMPGGGSVTLSAQNLRVDDLDQEPGLALKTGNYVKIVIGDQGVGIPEEHFEKIFDPYFSTKPMGVQKGMGLGLATAHAIVKKHGGDIIVESTPDVGTTVTIYLPAQPSEDTDKDEESLPSRKKATVADEQVPIRRVLLMDDEEMLRNLARHMLNELGYEVETVKDGIEAIELYKSQLASEAPFELVILDLTIKGGMGGEQALRELLKIDPDVKAIVSSGYFNDPVMENFQDYGFKGAMAKPYEMKDLKGAIEKALSVNT